MIEISLCPDPACLAGQRPQRAWIGVRGVPEDAAAVEALWSTAGLDGIETRELIDQLVARSLNSMKRGELVSTTSRGATYATKAADVRELHERLLDSYRVRRPDGFARAKLDGYFFEHLTTHLALTDCREELRDLLNDFRWLEAKLRAANVQALLAKSKAPRKGSYLLEPRGDSRGV